MELKIIISKEKHIINAIYEDCKTKLEKGQYLPVLGKNLNGELTNVFIENGVLYGIIHTNCEISINEAMRITTTIKVD